MFVPKNIKYIYLTIKRKIRNFLLNTKGREFLIFLAFFFVAFGFWLLQTLKDDYQTEFSLPLRIKDVPNNIVITSEIPEQIQVSVRDRGTVLLNYIVSQNFNPITLDFKDYERRGNHIRILGPELGRIISSQLNSSTTLIGTKPDTIDIIYTQGESKKLPIHLSGRVNSTRQYYITDTIFSPDSINVYAPNSILDTLQYAYTDVINLQNISDTIKTEIPFMSIKGVKYVPNTVTVTFPVDIITEKTLEIPLIPVDFPQDKVLRTFPSRVKVTFHVGLNRFKTINPEDFVIIVPYEDLIRNTSDKYQLKLQSYPNGISYARIIPAEIDYLIEQLPEDGD